MTGTLLQTPPAGPPAAPAGVGRDRAAVRLSVAVAGLMAVAAAAGLSFDGLYRDPTGLPEMFRGYDLVTLVVAVPLLAGSLALAGRGSVRARLLWLGTLGFAVYDYALYVFGASFNDLFLVHVAILTLAVVALGLGLRATPVQALTEGFGPTAPTRLVAGILAFLAVGLGAMWIFYALRFAVSGEAPAEGELVVPLAATHLGYALDLSLLVPAYATVAVLLWRRAPWGLILAPVVLVAGLLQQLTYVSALVFQARADIPGATAFDPAEPVVVAAYALGVALLLRRALWRGVAARSN